jgi:crotonobetainyl-CoA:carnitine CoA-transferase CaiB-like acyl-CoA transferase
MSAARADTQGTSLHGLVVLDLSHVLAGPMAGMLLADMGATVIKVESPRGEDTRHTPPFVDGESMVYRMVNRNKESLVLDLGRPEGAAVLKRLVAQADVLIENFRVGTMARWGLDYASLREINPRLVMASISGFGQTGPYAGRKGLDMIAQAMSGIMSITGEPDGPPVKCGIPISDLGSGLYAVVGILCALRHRDQAGVGQYVDTSLFEVGASLSVWQAAEYWGAGRVPQRWGSSHGLMIPYGAFATRDGHVVASGHSERLWPRFCEVIGAPGLPQDPRFCSVEQRLSHRKELQAAIEACTVVHDTAEWVERFEQAGIPAAPLHTYEQVLNDPHLQARGVLTPAGEGRTPVLGNPLTMSETPWKVRAHAPRLAQDSTAVLRRFGFGGEEIEALLRAETVIGETKELMR